MSDDTTQDPSTTQVEDRTPEQESGIPIITTDDSKPETSEVEASDVPQEKKEASKGVREMGEDRKLLVGTMLDAAAESDSAKEKFLALMESQPSIKKVVEKKFGDRLAILKGEKATSDESKTAEELKLEVRAELFLEMERKEQDEMVVSIAEKLSMNQDEADKLRKMAAAISKASGDNFDAALLKAAQIEKPSHARALSMPSGSSVSSAVSENLQITAEDKSLARALGKDPEYIAKTRRQLEKAQEEGNGMIIIAD